MPIGENAQYKSIVHDGVVVTATQTPEDVVFLQELIRKERPAVIVELGTFMGGLTLALHEAAPETRLYTCDRLVATEGEYVTTHPHGSHHYRRDWYGSSVVFCRADVLSETMAPELAEAFALPGRKLVLCDNGHKPTELRMYAPRLRRGDIIGVHDWPDEINAAAVEGSLDNYEPFLWDLCEEVGPGLLWRFWKAIAPCNILRTT